MKNEVVTFNDLPQECYVLQVDGRIKSKHRRFVDALKAGLLLKQEHPNSRIKVRNAVEPPPRKMFSH
jgi:hypothetical protein